MTDQRYFDLCNDFEEEFHLTSEELRQGWHFCWEYDGLLCNANHPDCKDCGCRCLKDYEPEKEPVH